MPRIRRKKQGEKTEMQRTIERLDDLWSEFIRKRAFARGHRCERCGAWIVRWQDLDAAHNHTRDNRTTRWDPRNGAGLCWGCHRYIDRHEEAKKELFDKLIGDPREVEMLYILTNMTTKQAPVDYAATEIYLRQQIKELDKLLAWAI